MIPIQKILDLEISTRGSVTRMKAVNPSRVEPLLIRPTLHVRDGSIVEVWSDEHPTKSETRQGWALVASVVVLSVFTAWLVIQ